VVLRDVVAVVYDGVGSFGLGVVSEVFGYDRSADGLPSYDFAVVTARPGRVRTDTGLQLVVEHGLERLATADLVCVLGWEDVDAVPDEALLQALRDAVARGARVMSHCTGAYVLAASGLLDGRRIATHWRSAADLAARYPSVTVDPDVLYVDDDPVFTSAGTAAGIDTCLYLLRREHGAAVDNAVARRMVVPPHREGGQAQYVDAAVPAVDDASGLREVLIWAQEHLETDLTVDELAARALMSPRSFARHFRSATGSTPHAWLLGQRLTRAQHLLEVTELPVDEVARRSGLGAATTLRHHFSLRFGTSPQAYRRTFRGRPPVAEAV
jgi:transcriptional regulator GlxA family with amidase domain